MRLSRSYSVKLNFLLPISLVLIIYCKLALKFDIVGEIRLGNIYFVIDLSFATSLFYDLFSFQLSL
jgi:hypothetical protein